MKIGRKLLISNIIITSISMIILTIIIRFIIVSYITDNIKDSIIHENRLIERMVLLGKDPFDKYDGGNKLPIHRKDFPIRGNFPSISIIVNLSQDNLLINGNFDISKQEIRELISYEDEKIIRVNFRGKDAVLYGNEIVDYDNNKYKIITMVFNNDIDSITFKITMLLILSIILISIIIVFTTRISEKMITNPIKILIKSTEKIGLKKFDEKVVINTNDEFQTLGESINRMAYSLKQKDNEQKIFYENISHELKTPLTVISGYAEGILTNIIDNSDEALDIIVKECRDLKRQIEDIIYLGKLDNIKEVFEFNKIDLNRVLAESLDKVESLIIMNDIDIYFEPEEKMFINGDNEKLVRAFINILSNCIKYTENKIEIRLKKEDEKIILYIEDNGCGFNEKVLNKPFSRFIVGEKDGTGIGLTIVKKVIDGHKALIFIENIEDGGARYKIEFQVF